MANELTETDSGGARLIIGGELVLYGVVGLGGFWAMYEDGFSASDVIDALSEMEGDITIRVNSGGGLVDDGVAIYNSLKRYSENNGKVTAIVDGIAASAASVLIMGATDILMPTGSTMMIHEGSMLTYGTKDDHEKSVIELDHFDDQIASIYAERSGKSVKEMRRLMSEETWLSGEEAIELGMANKKGKAKAHKPAPFNYLMYHNAPKPFQMMARKLGFADMKIKRKETMMTGKPKTEEETVAAPVVTEPVAAPPVQEPETVDVAAATLGRVKAILECDEAKGREDQARVIALDTDLPLAQAKALLSKSPKVEATQAGDKSFYAAAAAHGGDPKVPHAGTVDQSTQLTWDKIVDKVNRRIAH